MKTYEAFYSSPIGPMKITGTDRGITSISFVEKMGAGEENETVRDCIEQIETYFQKKLDRFTVKLVPEGTPFQQKVWEQVTKIPFGTTLTYSELASKTGKAKAVRAIGSAVGKNRFAIVIPCHRVVGKNQKVTGFAWEPWRKEWLLNHEQKS